MVKEIAEKAKETLAEWGITINASKALDWFEARFDGKCGECGGWFKAGDTIRRGEFHEFLCEICGDDS